MRKFRINRNGVKELPSEEISSQYKDFSRLTHAYDHAVKRPKTTLYRNKKMFLMLLLITLIAYILSAVEDERQDIDQKVPEGATTEQSN